MFGIWCGKDANVAVIEDFSIAFLRIKKDVITSVLRHHSYGTVGCVYGLGVKPQVRAVCCIRHPESGKLLYKDEAGKENLEKHERDTFLVESDGSMIYRMYDGTEFELTLSEEIHMEDFDRHAFVDPDMPLARRMALWNVGWKFTYGDGSLEVSIDTTKYSFFYSIDPEKDWIYCRVGLQGYCEKGWAMLSTVCIRANENRMLEDNLRSLQAYKPMEDCFVTDGCAFPSDGGWYWSVKKVTEDAVYLNGCGGDTYVIGKRR